MTSYTCVMITWVRLISSRRRCDTCLLPGYWMQKTLGKPGAAAVVVTEIAQHQQAGVGRISALEVVSCSSLPSSPPLALKKLYLALYTDWNKALERVYVRS